MQIERLDQIIVRAAVEALDAVLHRVARRQDQHRNLVSRTAQASQNFQSREPRQAEIEDHGRVLARLQCELRGDTVLHPIDAAAGL